MGTHQDQEDCRTSESGARKVRVDAAKQVGLGPEPGQGKSCVDMKRGGGVAGYGGRGGNEHNDHEMASQR